MAHLGAAEGFGLDRRGFLELERRFLGDGIFSIGYRHDEIIGVIDRLPLPQGLSAVGNIGDGTASFFQLRLTLPTDRLGIPNGRFQTRGSWSSTSVLDPVTGEERRFQGNQAFGQDRHQIRSGIGAGSGEIRLESFSGDVRVEIE